MCKQETLGPIDCAFQSFKKKRICNRFHRQLKRSWKVKEDGTQVARDIWTRTFDPWLKIVWWLKVFKLQSKGGNERTFPNIGVEWILISKHFLTLIVKDLTKPWKPTKGVTMNNYVTLFLSPQPNDLITISNQFVSKLRCKWVEWSCIETNP